MPTKTRQKTNELKTHVLSKGENHNLGLTNHYHVEMQVRFCHIFQLSNSVNLAFNNKYPDFIFFLNVARKYHEDK